MVKKMRRTDYGWEEGVIPFTAISVIGEYGEGFVRVEGGEVEVRGMDGSHVSMIRVKFPDVDLIPEGVYGIGSINISKSALKPKEAEYSDGHLILRKGGHKAELILERGENIPEMPTPRLPRRDVSFYVELDPLLKAVRKATRDLGRGWYGIKPMTLHFDYKDLRVEWERDEMPRSEEMELLEAQYHTGRDEKKVKYDVEHLLLFLEYAKRMGCVSLQGRVSPEGVLELEAVVGIPKDVEVQYWQAPIVENKR
jgi:hypothetical protein